MVFEIGKFYRHTTTGVMFHILGRLETTLCGSALVAEFLGKGQGGLTPVGDDEGSAAECQEATEEEWMAELE